MYERFTDRARKVMQLANQEAQRLNHEYIGCEHLLIALIKEGGGVAAHVMKAFGDANDLIKVLREACTPGPNFGVAMGKLPHTPRTKAVIQAAIAESEARKDGYVGTEHVLLALVRDPESLPLAALTAIGITPHALRDSVMNLLGDAPRLREFAGEKISKSADQVAAAVLAVRRSDEWPQFVEVTNCEGGVGFIAADQILSVFGQGDEGEVNLRIGGKITISGKDHVQHLLTQMRALNHPVWHAWSENVSVPKQAE